MFQRVLITSRGEIAVHTIRVGRRVSPVATSSTIGPKLAEGPWSPATDPGRRERLRGMRARHLEETAPGEAF